MSLILLGNEALAQGAKDAGVKVVSSYPGTPSTEITETIAALGGVYAEWAANEKVAAEVAMGAAVGGARAMCCMKHVGLNVASEVLFTGAYTGINGGLVFVVADDPGMHSSQNEQDTRFYAMSAHVPILEPSSAQEAYDFIRLAFEMSESCDIPVIIRMTTRIAHTRGIVVPREMADAPVKPYVKAPQKYVMMPNNARPRKYTLMANLKKVLEFAKENGINRVEKGSDNTGFICAGGVYQYVKEAAPEGSIYKVGMPYPMQCDEAKAFADSVADLYVVEELEPVMELQLNSFGIFPKGQDTFSKFGEYTAESVACAIQGEAMAADTITDLPGRPPVLCPGCPHRGAFTAIKRLKLNAFGDIGCYTLGANPPLSAMDSTVCMGASIGMTHGAALAQGEEFNKHAVAVIGDSTFFHSGLDGLASVCYNQSNITVLVLDNGTTGMTGHQDNPSTGMTLGGNAVAPIAIEDVAKAVGAKNIYIVDPLDLPKMQATLKEAVEADGVSVVIARHKCVLIDRSKKPMYEVDQQKCIGCGMCLQSGCPAMRKENGKVNIDPSMCRGCNLCVHLCPVGAIKGGC
ncbi:MAG: indolepyruvate ferredoxin oxidoreductase subunit alpha [Clostridiales bacterium]|nr:indolepyruvate ferredoxin oxidoreductase subunit alpha [Clostridiales bacterium]